MFMPARVFTCAFREFEAAIFWLFIYKTMESADSGDAKLTMHLRYYKFAPVESEWHV